MKILSLLGPLLRLAHRLWDWLEKQGREKDYAERQEKMDQAAADPANSFADHFGGMPNSSVPDDASSADKTDP